MINCLSTFIILLLLTSCSNENIPSKSQIKPLHAELITRKNGDSLYQLEEPTLNSPPTYPWNSLSSPIPKITKHFFRCKGDLLHPRKNSLWDCGGVEEHGLPLKDGEEFIYPILTDLLNMLQDKLKKKVIITSGHVCPEHVRWRSPSQKTLPSKQMIGAEVTFYVEGLETSPEIPLKLIMDYYQENSKYQNKKEYIDFSRYNKEDTDVTTQPWYNKEIFIKLYQKNEGRDEDNRHPFPYLSVQVRFDFCEKPKGQFLLGRCLSIFQEVAS